MIGLFCLFVAVALADPRLSMATPTVYSLYSCPMGKIMSDQVIGEWRAVSIPGSEELGISTKIMSGNEQHSEDVQLALTGKMMSQYDRKALKCCFHASGFDGPSSGDILCSPTEAAPALYENQGRMF